MIQSITLLLIAFLLLLLAFLYSKKPQIAITLIVICGFLLRLYVSNDPILHEWDEKYHALVAKNLMNNPFSPCLYKTTILDYNYKDWTTNHIWLHKPPLTLWSIAVWLKIFGLNEFGVRFGSLLFSTLSLLLTYFIATKLYNNKIGLLATFFQSINGFIIEVAGGRTATDHVDTLLLFLVELGVFLILYSGLLFKQKHTSILTIGFIMGLAVLCKWMVGLIILPLFIFYNVVVKGFNTNKIFFQTFLLTNTAIFISIPWFVYTYMNFPKEFEWEQLFNAKHLTESLEGHNHPWYFFIDNARINWNESIYIVFLIFVYNIYKKRNKSDLFILFWMSIPFIFFSLTATKMAGYVLIGVPPIFIMLALFCEKLWNKENEKYIMFKKILAALVVCFAIRYCFERVKPFQIFEKELTIKVNIDILRQNLSNDKNNIVFGFNQSINAMFYLDCISYPNYPTIEQFHNIDTLNYSIICVENGNVPDFIKAKKDIKLLKINE
jgi:4-amino-4-deoxy-L-arabinose transferase-like glycosyltransferase